MSRLLASAVLGGVLLLSAAAQEFVHGDECLFCHRRDIGLTWNKNAHALTMRQKEDAADVTARLQADPKLAPFGAAATHTLGSRHVFRYLKQNGYGKQDLLSNATPPAWQPNQFANRCAGCHATAVDPQTHAYSEIGIDCYACHGLVDLQHSNDTTKIFLSKKRRTDLLAITSTCAQCHLRGGKSKTTGLPYPNAYIAGGNLFQDYQVDWSAADDPAMNPGDRHVWKNVRDVVKNGGNTTCLSCHRIHANTADRHRRVLTGPICEECHNATGPKKAVKTYAVHSALCEY